MKKQKVNIKKPNEDEYCEWFKEKFNKDISLNKYENHYDSVTDRLKKNFENSSFWKTLSKEYSNFDIEYQIDKKYELFTEQNLPIIQIKPYKSFIQKTYRKNVLDNQLWPNKPVNDWITPDNWFERTNDVIRTLFKVKYLDGVKFIIKKIDDIGKKNSLKFEPHFEAKEEGYYAVHMYSKMKMEIPNIDFDTEFINFPFEFQITTQLQELIRNLLHKYYEEQRLSKKPLSINWKWDYKSNEFAINYLGHILHYLEGMILEVRDKH